MHFIDVHIHGFSGIDIKDATPQEILTIARLLAGQGIRGFVPTIYPRHIDKMRMDMENITKAIAIQKSGGRGNEAEILGIHLEGPFLNPLRSGALDANAFLAPTEDNLKMLIDGFEDIIKIIVIAPEIDGALHLIKKIANIGIIVSMGHSEADYAEAEAGFNAGAKGITHIFNAMRGFHHREPGLAGFGIINPHVYIELITDPYHLHIKTIEMVFRIKNPDRIIIVSDSVKNTGIMSPVADNGDTLLGGSMSIHQSAKRLIDRGFDRNKVIKCIVENPAGYLEGIFG